MGSIFASVCTFFTLLVAAHGENEHSAQQEVHRLYHIVWRHRCAVLCCAVLCCASRHSDVQAGKRHIADDAC